MGKGYKGRIAAVTEMVNGSRHGCWMEIGTDTGAGHFTLVDCGGSGKRFARRKMVERFIEMAEAQGGPLLVLVAASTSWRQAAEGLDCGSVRFARARDYKDRYGDVLGRAREKFDTIRKIYDQGKDQ